MNKRPITVEDLLDIIDLEDPQISPNGQWVAYVERRIDRLENAYRTHIWLAPTEGGENVQLTQSSSDSQPRWSPDGTKLAFTSKRGGQSQVYIIRIGGPGGEAYPITSMPNGAHSPVWSPDGQRIAFLSSMDADERKHEDSDEEYAQPLDKLEAKQRREHEQHTEDKRFDPLIADRIPYRDGYGKTYLDGRFQQIYVMDIDKKAPERLTDLDANYTAPIWTPDGGTLITVRPSDPGADEPSRLDRMYRIDLAGKIEKVMSEEPTADRLPALSPDGTQVAYIRTPHELQYTRVPILARLDVNGVKDLTIEFDRTATNPAWSTDGTHVYFIAHSEGKTELHRIPASGGTIEKVVAAPNGTFIQVQAYAVGGDGGIAYFASTPKRPAELFYRAPDATSALQLTQVNQSLLNAVIVQPTQEITYASYDDSQVQGWYIPPVASHTSGAPPLVVQIHGGPRVMANPASKMWHEWQLYAARGYGVFFCNAHSSDGYGQEFQRHAYGEPDFPDHMAGVDVLIERGLADPDRLLVTGGSYGGYMTAWVVSHTNRFKAAVAQRGVYNLLSHYGTTDFPIPTEHEFDVKPWEKPMLIWERSPLAHAHKIETPLLIMHSENDYRCLISEAEQLFSYMRLAGRTARLVRFPREGHPLSRNGEPEHRIQRLNLMLDWFETHCDSS